MTTAAASPPDSGPEPARPWSWRRALLHAAIVVAALVLVGAIVSAAGLVRSPQRLGEGLGRFALFAGAVTFGVSRLAQMGRRRLAWALAVGAVSIVAVIVGVLVGLAPKDLRLTAADRAPLETVVVDDARLLRHPVLGFSVPHPGPAFEFAPEVARALAGEDIGDSIHAWGYLDRATGEALAILLARGLETREEIDGFLRGIRASLSRAEATVEREDIAWEAGHREIRIDIAHPSGMRLAFRVVGARLGSEGTPYVVAAMATTGDPTRAAFLVENLRVP